MAVHRGDKRVKILDAATRLILTKGVHATSITDIITESGASAGAIYHHFANKNDIVLAVARARVADPLQARLAGRSNDGGLSPSELFRLIAETLLSGEIEPALTVQLWAGSSGEPELKALLREQMTDVRERAALALEEWLAARGSPAPQEHAQAVASLAVGQAMGLLVQDTLVVDFDREAYLVAASAMLDCVAP